MIVGHTSRYSAMLSNYGPIIAEVRMKNSENNKGSPINSDIVIEFKKKIKLLVGHSVLFHVTCNPTLAKYTERYATLERIIRLEVIQRNIYCYYYFLIYLSTTTVLVKII